MTLPASSIRIKDLQRLNDTATMIAKAPLLIPVASDNATPNTYAIELGKLLQFLADTGLANIDLSNLSPEGQLVIDSKLNYLLLDIDTDLNSLMLTSRYNVEASGSIDINGPNIFSGRAQVDHIDFNEHNAFQQFIAFEDATTTWIRRKINDVWTVWFRTTQNQANPTFENAPLVNNTSTNPNALVTFAQLTVTTNLILPYNNLLNYGWIYSGMPTFTGNTLTAPKDLKFMSSTGSLITMLDDTSILMPAETLAFLDEEQHFTLYSNSELIWDDAQQKWFANDIQVNGVLVGSTDSLGNFSQDTGFAIVTTKTVDSFIRPMAIRKRNRITGIWTPWTAPTILNDVITIPESIYQFFNPEDLSGNNIEVNAAESTLIYNSSMGTNQTIFIIATLVDSGINYTTRNTLPHANEMTTNCVIGSIYVNDIGFDDDTFSVHPWMVDTNIEQREIPDPKTSGLLITGNANGTLTRSTGNIIYEGINAPMSNVLGLNEATPALMRWRYPNRSSAFATQFTEFAANGGYVNDGSPDLIDKTSQNTDKYVVFVFGMIISQINAVIPPNVTDVFDTQNEALQALPGLLYDRGINYDIRTAWTCSAIYKVGSTDLSDPANFFEVNSVPNQLNPSSVAPALMSPMASEVAVTPTPALPQTNAQTALEALALSASQNASNLTEFGLIRRNGALLVTPQPIFFGQSPTIAVEQIKQVSINAITSQDSGIEIVVIPAITANVADMKLQLNAFTAFPITFEGSQPNAPTSSKIWVANVPVSLLFTGSEWVITSLGSAGDALPEQGGNQGKVLGTDGANPVWVDVAASPGVGGAGRNIGDIFWTTRTDTALAGAVECNGGTYSTADYTGDGSIGELLAGGKLDYISLTDYATAISTKGCCDKIGWDGTGTTSFRVPKLAPKRYVVKTQEPTADNNYTGYRLYNDGWVEQSGFLNNLTTTAVNITLPKRMINVDYKVTLGQHTNDKTAQVLYLREMPTVTTIKLKSSAGTIDRAWWEVSGQSAIVSDPTERAMFQLFNGTTDEAVATVGTVVAQVGTVVAQVGTVVAQVGELNAHRVIEFQAPTAENGYTWYRKYADGWVEQGGRKLSGTKIYTLPVEMADTNYYINCTDIDTNVLMVCNRTSTTQINLRADFLTGGEHNAWAGTWMVCGQAA